MSFIPLHRALLLLSILPVLTAGGAPTQDAEPTTRLRFEAADDRGLDFVHVNGRTPERNLPETMGSGLAWLDYDRDGDPDLYLVQSGALPGGGGSAEPVSNALYRNDGTARFARVATGAEHGGYGMGVTVGDYDADGWADLYVTNFGRNVLYRSNGDGTFSEQPAAGIDDPRWSASASWGDLTGDGLLDLYVTHYLAYDPATAIRCGDGGETAYCHVDLFDGIADSLYRNLGDGTFEDIAAAADVANAAEGKGLGVVFGDIDDDGLTDIYVANDTQQNFLYRALGNGAFEDQGLFSGTGYSAEGKAQAGMGTELVDLDGDGADEILVTNFAFEPYNLYRRFAPDAYLEESFPLGLGEPTLALLGFGIVALDLDADGDREIAVANGHILDTVEAIQDGTPYAQPNQLFDNRLTRMRTAAGAAPGDGWRPAEGLLREVTENAGSGFEPVEVSRGLAAGDADGDGLADLVFSNSGGPARLLLNRSDAGRRLVLRIRDRTGARDGYGARVIVTPRGGDPDDGVTGFPQHFEVRAASSYLSQNDGDLYVGLADAAAADVEVIWTDGERSRFEALEPGGLVLIDRGRGEPLRSPLRAPSR